MSAYKIKLKEFESLLSDPELDTARFRTICFSGVPDGQGRRALAWRLLLNYLPAKRAEWDSFLEQQRRLYLQLLDDIVLSRKHSGCEADHPLNPSPNSGWQSFFKDNDVLLQIDKDVRRLCPDISFFSQATDYPHEQIASGQKERLHQRVQQKALRSQCTTRKGLGAVKLSFKTKQAVEDYAPLDDGQEAHWEVVERILFLYAKLNPGQSYIQGMNEIMGPIYYVFASDPKPEWRRFAEADCFFCFTNLMADIRDFFIKTLDEAESGINGMMLRLMSRLKALDPHLVDLFQRQEIRPQYFLLRWLTVMLSQEFPLPEVLRIWDSLLSDETRSDFLLSVCTAMLLLIRDELLSNEFPENMKLLQNYPPIDVNVILNKAVSISSSSSAPPS